MRISTRPAPATLPWVTLSVELAGGTLSWQLFGDRDDAHLHLWASTDAGWLWRLVGEPVHARLLAQPRWSTTEFAIDEPAVPEELRLLHRLAWGHWLRRWWPTSVVDGLDPLADVVLDVEVALLTVDCDGYFDDDSFDGDPRALVARHSVDAIDSLATHFSPEVRTLHRRWLAYDADIAAPVRHEQVRRADDYALAAGPTSAEPRTGGIAGGRASVAWESVPANTFDAAEDTLVWSVDSVPELVADVAVRLLPGRESAPVWVELRLPDPPMTARGQLDPAGTSRIPLPLTAAQAWQTDWSSLQCSVAGVVGDLARTRRDDARALIRRRLSGTHDGTPLFVAEQLVAEADY